MTNKTPGPKESDKRKRNVLTKLRYKVKVLIQPVPTTATPTQQVNSIAPTPTVATASTQMPVVKSTATSIPVTVYNLATGKFSKVPHPSARPQNEESFHTKLQPSTTGRNTQCPCLTGYSLA